MFREALELRQALQMRIMRSIHLYFSVKRRGFGLAIRPNYRALV